MSISGSLNNAISGLTASSRMAEVVSSNLANTLTEGYGKREVILASGQLGGVTVQSVLRNVDPVILAERRLADASLNLSERSAAMLDRVENAIGGPSDPYSIAAKLTAFEQALVSASADPSSEQRLRLIATRVNELTQAMASASRSIQVMRQEADANIASDVEQLNTSLKQVARLNADISRAIATGSDTGALKDARQLEVDKIAKLVPLKEIARPNDGIALITTRGAILLDGQPAEFSFNQTPTIVADMTIEGGVLGEIEMNGQPLVPSTGFGRLTGGAIEASFKLRDQTLTSAQRGLDQFAADLITRFEDSSVDPTLTGADSGLLTDAGMRFDATNLDGLASRIQMNATADPSKGGDVRLLRDGIMSTVPGPVGDSLQLSRWIEALEGSHSFDGLVPPRSAAAHLSQFVSEIGTARVRADEEFSFESARWNAIRESELSNGVDSDQELQRLLVIEQTYAANARVIQTISAMLQSIMDL